MKLFRYCSEKEVSRIIHGETLISDFSGTNASTSKGFCFADDRLIGNFEVFNYLEFPTTRPLFIYEIEDTSILTKSYGRYTERFIDGNIAGIVNELERLSKDREQVEFFKELLDRDITSFVDRVNIAQAILDCEVEDDKFISPNVQFFLSGGWKEECYIKSYNQELIKPIKVVLDDNRVLEISSLLDDEYLKTNDKNIALMISSLYPEKINELNDEFRYDKDFLKEAFLLNNETIKYISPFIANNETFKQELFLFMNQELEKNTRKLNNQYKDIVLSYFDFYNIESDREEIIEFINNFKGIFDRDKLLNEVLGKINEEYIDDDFVFQILEKKLENDFIENEPKLSLGMYALVYDLEEFPILSKKLQDENLIQYFLENSKSDKSVLFIPKYMLNTKYKEAILKDVYSYYLENQDTLDDYSRRKVKDFIEDAFDGDFDRKDFMFLYEDGVIDFKTILNNESSKDVIVDIEVFRQIEREKLLKDYKEGNINIDDIDKDFLNNKEFVISLFKIDCENYRYHNSCFKYMDDSLKNDKEFLLETLKISSKAIDYIKEGNPKILEDNSFLIDVCRILKETSENERMFRINLEKIDFTQKIRTDIEFFDKFCKEIDPALGIDKASYVSFEWGYPKTKDEILERITEYSKDESFILKAMEKGVIIVDMIDKIDKSLITEEFFAKLTNKIEDFDNIKNLQASRFGKEDEVQKRFTIFLKENMKSVLESGYEFDFSEHEPKFSELIKIYEGTIPEEDRLSLLKEAINKNMQRDRTNEYEISDKNFSDILQILNDDYSINDLENLGISKREVSEFLDFLNEKNITVENAKALNLYSNGSNMILGIKKGVVEKETILKNICKDTTRLLEERKVSSEQISMILEFVKGLDYSNPLHKNYELSNAFLEENGLRRIIRPTVNTCIKNINSLEKIDYTIAQIDDALDRATLGKSATLYRGISLEEDQIKIMLQDGILNNEGYTSTSTTYENSFIKYPKCNVGLIMSCDEDTKGIEIAPFSDYGSSEKEILLAPNTFEISNLSERDGKLIFEGNTRQMDFNIEL